MNETIVKPEDRTRFCDALLPCVDAYAQHLAKYYAAVGWEWVAWDRETRRERMRYVPSALQIADCLRGLIERARTNETGCCGTGGIEVVVRDDGAYITFSDTLEASADSLDEIGVFPAQFLAG